MPVDAHSLALFFVTSIVAMVIPGPAVGVLAGRIGDWLRHRHAARRRLNVAVGSLFIGLGLRLAAER